MADYKETTVSGTQWQRCNAIHIQNTYGHAPTVTMQEEQITTVGGQQFSKSMGGLNVPFNPSESIPLLNPADGTSLGTSMTQGQIQVALWSLYMAKATARDAQG